MMKTNAVRILENLGISFELKEYEADGNNLSAVSVARKSGIDIDTIFKTLVLRSGTGEIIVCVIPGECVLNLKKAAAVSGHKKVELIPVKEIQPLTGYIRGGCSPIGMKKTYPTYIDESCNIYDRIHVSAGIRGLQLYITPQDLISAVPAQTADLV